MRTALSWTRYTLACILAAFATFCGYPILFMMQHGSNSLAWPENAGATPFVWFSKLSGAFPSKYPDILFLGSTYLDMWLRQSPAFADGGFLAAASITAFTLVACAVILGGGDIASRRVRFGQYGNAKWAPPEVIADLDKGIEIGINLNNLRPARIQIEGNLLTIAPPRSGKTGGFIIPNLAFPEPNAWAGPAVVVDPKGDVYRAVRRRREAMGRVVRCVDPLSLAGGADRWNPLARVDPNDILYLQSMANALLPPMKEGSDSNSYFQSRANDVIVAAILSTVRNGRADPVGAAELLMQPAELQKALESHVDHSSLAAAEILAMEPKSREDIISTAQLATQ